MKCLLKVWILVVLLLVKLISIHAQSIVINEIQASNSYSLEDEDGNFSDWVELFNYGNEAINMEGFFLTDEAASAKWTFPFVEIAPQSYLMVFASSKNRAFPNLHTSFKLSAEGESVILANQNLEILDSIDFPEMIPNVSFARVPNVTGEFQLIFNPSPGQSNETSIKYNPIVNTNPSGIYQNELFVSLEGREPAHEIYFTLDGKEPSLNDFSYNEELHFTENDLDKNNLINIPTTPLDGPEYFNEFIWKEPTGDFPEAVTLRYRSFLDGQPSSPIYTKTYFVNETGQSPFTFPVMALTTDSLNLFDYETGIYVPGAVYGDGQNAWWAYWPFGNYLEVGDEWEKPAHLVYFSEMGEILVEQDLGISAHGWSSVTYPQKSLNINARNRYGKKEMNHDFFGDPGLSKYKNLVLRNSGNDFKQTRFRDALLNDLTKDLNLETQKSKPCILFINGEYWGIFNIREKYSDHYFEEKFEVEEWGLDFLENKLVVNAGDSLDFQNMLDYMVGKDLNQSQVYDSIANLIDIDNYIDYHATEIFVGNIDWPGNNIGFWRNKKELTKWRWLIFDLDSAFGYEKRGTGNYSDYKALESILDEDGTSWPNPPWATFLFRKLMENQNFQDQFVLRLEQLMNTTFQPDNIINLIRQYKDLYQPEIEMHSRRWQYPSSVSSWEGEINSMIDYAITRSCIVKEHFIEQLQLDEFDYDCDNYNCCVSNIFPNPSDGLFKISFEIQRPLEHKLYVHDFLGRLIQEKKFLTNSGIYNQVVDLRAFPPGIYFVTVPSMDFSGKLISR